MLLLGLVSSNAGGNEPVVELIKGMKTSELRDSQKLRICPKRDGGGEAGGGAGVVPFNRIETPHQ